MSNLRDLGSHGQAPVKSQSSELVTVVPDTSDWASCQNGFNLQVLFPFKCSDSGNPKTVKVLLFAEGLPCAPCAWAHLSMLLDAPMFRKAKKLRFL